MAWWDRGTPGALLAIGLAVAGVPGAAMLASSVCWLRSAKSAAATGVDLGWRGLVVIRARLTRLGHFHDRLGALVSTVDISSNLGSSASV